MENIFIESRPISIASFDNYKEATFLISVLDEPDLYGRIIPKESGELYHNTIVGYPLVAKLKTSLKGKPIDFGGHEKTIVKENGKKRSKFNTVAIGSFTESSVVPMELDGYEGEKNCIIAKCKLWVTRFPEYFKVFDKLWEEGNLKSSWEMTVSESEDNGENKILKIFEFIGAAALGKAHTPAVPGGGVIEYAELEKDIEADLAEALEKDICFLSKNESEKEDICLSNSNVDTNVKTEASTETAALTQWDLQKKIEAACCKALRLNQYDGYVAFWFPEDHVVWFAQYGRESELDYIACTYEVENDVVTISEHVDVRLTVKITEVNTVLAAKEKEIKELQAELTTKDEAIIKAGETVSGLNAKIAELEPYKEAAEQAEQKRIETEIAEHKESLKKNLLKTKLFTEEEVASAEIAELIEARNETAIKTLIADRYIASFDKNVGTPEVAEFTTEKPTATASLETDDSDESPTFIMRRFLKVD